MVELDDAIRRHQRVVIRQRHHTGAEADLLGSLCRGGDENLGRGDDLEACRVMLADPGFFVAKPVQVLDQFKVAMKCFSWILVERVKRGQEDAIAHRNRAGHSSGASFRLSFLGSSLEYPTSDNVPKRGLRLIFGPLQVNLPIAKR